MNFVDGYDPVCLPMCKSEWMEKKIKYNLIFLKVEQNKTRVYWIVNGRITDISSNENGNAENSMRQNESGE